MTRPPLLLIVLATTIGVACTSRHTGPVPAAQQREIQQAIRAEVTSAYDFSRQHVVANLMSLYPTHGPVISASGGRVVTSRDSLQKGIEQFWANVGSNMRNPRMEWTAMYIDVLAPNAAVMTATYRIPHVQPNGMQHVIGGAWTAAFEKQGTRWVIVQEHLSDNPMP